MLENMLTEKDIRSSRGSCIHVDARVLGGVGRPMRKSCGDLPAFIVMS